MIFVSLLFILYCLGLQVTSQVPRLKYNGLKKRHVGSKTIYIQFAVSDNSSETA